MTDPRLLLLDERDNVLVLTKQIASGEALLIEGRRCQVARDLPLGHKVARCAIAAGDEILKYGAPIGIATAEIQAGAHVHVHNLRSNYTATHVLPEDGTKP